MNHKNNYQQKPKQFIYVVDGCKYDAVKHQQQ